MLKLFKRGESKEEAETWNDICEICLAPVLNGLSACQASQWRIYWIARCAVMLANQSQVVASTVEAPRHSILGNGCPSGSHWPPSASVDWSVLRSTPKPWPSIDTVDSTVPPSALAHAHTCSANLLNGSIRSLRECGIIRESMTEEATGSKTIALHKVVSAKVIAFYSSG